MDLQSDVPKVPAPVLNEQFSDKVKDLQNALTEDILACDVKWSLFIAAAQSFHYASRLKPYPQKYTVDDCVDIEKIRAILAEVPSLDILHRSINTGSVKSLSTETIELVHYVLVTLKRTIVKSVKKEQFQTILGKVSDSPIKIKPNSIIEVTDSFGEDKFKFHAQGLNTNYAFHGSKLDSFHSILNYGLQQHLSKNALYGEGTYLSSDLSISLSYSPMSLTWGKSLFGTHLSCIALCEFVEHPFYLQRHVKSEKGQRQRKKSEEIPEQYFIVTNNDILKIRYLLIFGKGGLEKKRSEKSALMHWASANKSFLMVCCYVLVLATVGLVNSKTGQMMTRKTKNFIKNLIEPYL